MAGVADGLAEAHLRTRHLQPRPETLVIGENTATAEVSPIESAAPPGGAPFLPKATEAAGTGSLDECHSPAIVGAGAHNGRASPGGAYERLDQEENSRLRSWKQGESLGRGAYGEVFKAMVAGRFMAVKKIPLDLSLNPKAAEKEIAVLLLEINTLKRLKHPRIVRYHGCIRQDTEEDPALLIFLEFMPSGSIKGVLAKFGPYGIGLVRKYTRQILEGLEFLHSEKIVHRDVKGANILIDAEGDAKLADFGACRELEALQSTVTGGFKSIHGSVYWMAPEVMKYSAGRRSDIWSLGCTVIEMITAEAPWPNLREEKLTVPQMLTRIVEGPEGPPIPGRIPDDCRSFLQHSLVRDHAKRPYAHDLLKHRFVAHQDGTPSRASTASGSPPSGPRLVTEAWGASPKQTT